MRFIKKFWKWIRRMATLLVFLFMLAFVVASHTIEAISVLTAGAIRLATGMSSVNTAAFGNKNGLENSLAKETARVAEQSKEIASLEKKTELLEKDLKDVTADSSALLVKNAELKAAQEIDFRGTRMSVKAASMQIVDGVKNRTKKVAAANAASVFGEGIPFYGIAIIVGATTFELKSACDTMKDLYDLEEALAPGSEHEDTRDYVCGLQVPTKDEVWSSISSSPAVAWQKSVDAYDETTDWVSSLEMPDFSGRFSKAMNWLSSWFD